MLLNWISSKNNNKKNSPMIYEVISYWPVIVETTLCDQLVRDLGQVGGFLGVLLFPPRYNWNIVQSGIKHHIPNQTKPVIVSLLCMIVFRLGSIIYKVINCFTLLNKLLISLCARSDDGVKHQNSNSDLMKFHA